MERNVCADNRAKGEYPGPPQLAARWKKPCFWSVTTVITCNDAHIFSPSGGYAMSDDRDNNCFMDLRQVLVGENNLIHMRSLYGGVRHD